MKYKTIKIAILFFIITHNLSAVVNIESLRNTSSNNEISFHLTVKDGNSKKNQLDLKYTNHFEHNKINYFTILKSNYEINNGTKSENNGLLHFRRVSPASLTQVNETFIQIEYDEFLDLLERKLIGFSRRFKLNNVYLGVGIMAESQLYDDQENNLQNYFWSTNYLSYKLKIKKDVSINGVHYLQGKLHSDNAYRLLSTLELVHQLTQKINLKSSIEHKYNSNPESNNKEYDLNIKTSIGYKF